MTKHEYPKRASVAFAFALVLQLSACGGGGGGSPASSAPPPSLSVAQQNYESVALSSNGGLHHIAASLSFSINSSGALAAKSGSYFYADDSSLSASPATGAQRLTTGQSSLAPSLGLPAISASRYLVNGAIVTGTVPATVQISYSGGDVVATYLASDGHTPLETLQGTSYAIVPLSGAIANSPAELLTDSALSVLTQTINGQSLYNTSAAWQPNAEYIKATRNYVGDTVLTGDCVAPVTTGINVTPCSVTASTLEAFFHSRSITPPTT